MAPQPSIPKGTRDFMPDEMARRNFIFNTIKEVYHRHGYLPIETPAMENIETLTGKYGEEGEQLLFRILDSGDFLKDADETALRLRNSRKLSSSIASKGLRYDLTVPFARFVVMHRNELTFPFKRYQIQTVWRADRPQKGRYREFYQCDADVIGSGSLLYEAEMIRMIHEVFTHLNIPVEIHLNNRKVLSAIIHQAGISDKFDAVAAALDKIEKAGIEQVIKEIEQAGIAKNTAEQIIKTITLNGSNNDNIHALKTILTEEPDGRDGLAELEQILEFCAELKITTEIKISPSLARGLNYYTGTILEVKARNIQMGSICGGGRYDNLTGVFGVNGLSGIGISFGAERIYDIMQQQNLFPENLCNTVVLLLANFGKHEEKFCLGLLTQIHSAGISAELYPEKAKLAKQLNYANHKKIPFVALIGEKEIAARQITIKNMNTGEQISISVEQLIPFLQKPREFH